MGRCICHSDANGFYASVECLYDPAIRDKPVAVCGDPDLRHGIILAKNEIAKRYKIKTAETISEARQKCPGLVLVKPNYKRYVGYTKKLRKIYSAYSDRVEPYGLDEAWFDISSADITIGKARQTADEIRSRVKKELGITLSIGVAPNKIYAKLGSDMKKPDATTVITRLNYKEKVWPLPASDLLFVGPATTKKLANLNILTIGDLANAENGLIKGKLGKVGTMLQIYAQGNDISPVLPTDVSLPIKSVGNSMTPPHDLRTIDDVKCLFYILAESIAKRLRKSGFRSRCISISVRKPDLSGYQCQQTIPLSTNVSDDIVKTAMELFVARYAHMLPFRSAGIHCSSLVSDILPIQMDVFGDAEQQAKKERLERVVDDLREQYGYMAVQRGITLFDRQFAQTNPHDDHFAPAMPFYAGGVS